MQQTSSSPQVAATKTSKSLPGSSPNAADHGTAFPVSSNGGPESTAPRSRRRLQHASVTYGYLPQQMQQRSKDTVYLDSSAARHALAEHTDTAHPSLRVVSPPVVVPVNSGSGSQGGSSGARTFLPSPVVKQPQAWPQSATAVPTEETNEFGLERYEGAYFASRGAVYEPSAAQQTGEPYFMPSNNRYSAPVVRSSAPLMPASSTIMTDTPAERNKRNKQRRKSHIMAQSANNGGGGTAAVNGSANSCSSPTQQRQGTLKPELYKTELCRKFQETGSCRYGAKCQFAHGEAELRPVQRHPLYKTELCRMYHTLGHCNYGTRCRFIHDSPDEGQYVGSSTTHSAGSCSPQMIDIGPRYVPVANTTLSQRRGSTSLSPISLGDVNTFSYVGKDPVPNGSATERRAGTKYRGNGVFARNSMYFDTSGAQVSKLIQANAVPTVAEQALSPVLARTAPVSPSPSDGCNSPVQVQPGAVPDFYVMAPSPRQQMAFTQQNSVQEQQQQQQQQQFGPPRASSDPSLNPSGSLLFQQQQQELLQSQQVQPPIPAAPGHVNGPQPQYKFSSKMNSPVPYVPQPFFVMSQQQQQQPEPVPSEQAFLASGLSDQTNDKGAFGTISGPSGFEYMPHLAPSASIPGTSQLPLSLAGISFSPSGLTDQDISAGSQTPSQTPSGLDEKVLEQQLRLFENLDL